MGRHLAVWLVCLAAMSLAFAQEQPVLLQYKFAPGRADTYVVQGTGTLPVTIAPAPEGQIQGMGFDVVLEMSMTMKYVCKAVLPDGSAQVEMTFPAMDIRMSIPAGEQSMDMVTKWENGALTNTINGEAQPEDDNTRKLTQALAATLKMTIKPTGEQTPDPETVKLMSELYNSSAFSGMDMTRLSALTSRVPTEPVAPGATWKVKDEVNSEQMSFSGESQMKFTGYEDWQGVRTARIEGQATMSMNGEMPGAKAPMQGLSYNISKLEANISFVNHFDPVRGVMPLAQSNMAQNMIMMITMAGLTGNKPMHLPTTIENGQMTMETRLQ